MRNCLLALTLVVLAGLAGTASAQAPQQPDVTQAESRERLHQVLAHSVVQKQVELIQALLAQQEAARQASTCADPGNAPVALNEEIFFDGRAYRCVEVFGPNDAPGMANAPPGRRSVGLVRVAPQGP